MMKLSIVLRPNDLIVRLPPPEDPDVGGIAVSVVRPGEGYWGLSYGCLRSLGDSGWDIPDNPAERIDHRAKRLPSEVLDCLREKQEALRAGPQPAKVNT